MSKQTYRYWLTFPVDQIQKPLIWEMSQKFKVVFIIKQASITKEVGIMALELSGETSEVEAAVKWLESKQIQVEPVEINIIEG